MNGIPASSVVRLAYPLAALVMVNTPTSSFLWGGRRVVALCNNDVIERNRILYVAVSASAFMIASPWRFAFLHSSVQWWRTNSRLPAVYLVHSSGGYDHCFIP